MSNNDEAVLSGCDTFSQVKCNRVACFFGWSGQESPLGEVTFEETSAM